MKRAFTLIELLVVIAIITMLTAIGLPVMRRVREQGAETICKSNLRQMALLLKTYAGDHDGFFPESGLHLPFTGLVCRGMGEDLLALLPVA